MRTRMFLATAAALYWVLLGNVLLAGGDKAGNKEGKKPSPAEMMEMMAKLAKPGPAHKQLEPLVGNWTCKVKFYGIPGQGPQESAGTVTRKWIMGNRFIEEHFKGTAMGQPFTGFGLTGYDNSKKKYTAAWIDSMSTALLTTKGTYDAGTKTFTYSGEELDPYTGKRTKSRDLLRVIDNDTHVMEMYRLPQGGTEFKMLEITCKRKK